MIYVSLRASGFDLMFSIVMFLSLVSCVPAHLSKLKRRIYMSIPSPIPKKKNLKRGREKKGNRFRLVQYWAPSVAPDLRLGGLPQQIFVRRAVGIGIMARSTLQLLPRA